MLFLRVILIVVLNHVLNYIAIMIYMFTIIRNNETMRLESSEEPMDVDAGPVFTLHVSAVVSLHSHQLLETPPPLVICLLAPLHPAAATVRSDY